MQDINAGRNLQLILTDLSKNYTVKHSQSGGHCVLNILNARGRIVYDSYSSLVSSSSELHICDLTCAWKRHYAVIMCSVNCWSNTRVNAITQSNNGLANPFGARLIMDLCFQQCANTVHGGPDYRHLIYLQLRCKSEFKLSNYKMFNEIHFLLSPFDASYGLGESLKKG